MGPPTSPQTVCVYGADCRCSRDPVEGVETDTLRRCPYIRESYSTLPVRDLTVSIDVTLLSVQNKTSSFIGWEVSEVSPVYSHQQDTECVSSIWSTRQNSYELKKVQ